MRQAFALLAAIFHPLGALIALIEVVLGYMRRLDAIFGDAELSADLRARPEGLRTVESGIAFAEHWIGIAVAMRASELAGRRMRIDARWAGWAPGKARGWDSLMQRYRRCREQLGLIERLAARRAARMMRDVAASPPVLAAPMMMIRDEHHHDRALIIMPLASGQASRRARGPPDSSETRYICAPQAPPAGLRAFMCRLLTKACRSGA